MTLVDIARNQAQRDIDKSRDPRQGNPGALKELEKYKALTVLLADSNKELKLQVRAAMWWRTDVRRYHADYDCFSLRSEP